EPRDHGLDPRRMGKADHGFGAGTGALKGGRAAAGAGDEALIVHPIPGRGIDHRKGRGRGGGLGRDRIGERCEIARSW
ncbi:MAG TPA: hypothetical protein DCK97_15700, partial [Tistrella mobilis]|nr:hypothetical protein [Tistrella mobilis]